MSTSPDPIPWCHAPTSALYFDPLGYVYPCCTGRQPLGRIGSGSGRRLREIWNGAIRASVEAAVAAADLSRGCADCAQAAESAGRDAALAVHFDRWGTLQGDGPVDLEFALSNTCNLQCVMCNGMLSSAIRSQRDHDPPLPAVYDDRFFDDLAQLLPGVRRVAFKGGEPFLAREARRVMDLLIEQGSTAEIKITTNATVWSDRVEHYLRELRMEPIVSIDAMDPEVLEAVRVGAHADHLWENVARIERVAREVGRTLTFSYCFMPETWQELAPLLVEAESRGAYVAVAHVSQPPDQSLLGLDVSDLTRIRSEMAAREARLEDLRPENREAWNQALAWVDYCAEGRREAQREIAVELSSGRDDPPASDRPAPGNTRPEADLAELRGWSGAGSLVVHATDGLVTGVSMPDWAGGRDLDIVGRRVDVVQSMLTQLVGAELEPDIDEMGHMATTPAGEVAVRAVYFGMGADLEVHLALSPAARARVLAAGS